MVYITLLILFSSLFKYQGASDIYSRSIFNPMAQPRTYESELMNFEPSVRTHNAG